MSEETEILATFDVYADAYCAKDIDGLMELFDGGDDISLIGTGADELCTGRAEIRSLFERNFSEATAERFEWHWRHLTRRGDAATVAASLTIHLSVNGNPLTVPIRWTVSLHRLDERWLWLHRHASAAATNQDDGAAYPGRTHSWRRDPAVRYTDLDPSSVLLDPRTQRIFDLNPAGRVVWESIDEGIETAVERVIATFAVDEEAARRDVALLVAQLADAGLVVPDG